jgi:hypothetical protein
MFYVLVQRVVAQLPPIQRLVAEEAGDIVGVRRRRVEEETGSGKLGTGTSTHLHAFPCWSTRVQKQTFSGDRNLWGQLKDLDALEFADDVLRLFWTVWKEARRLSRLKNWSVNSVADMLTELRRLQSGLDRVAS